MDRYIKVTYDVQKQKYDVFFAYHNALFLKHSEQLNQHIWTSAIRSAMMRAPNIIVFGELSETGDAVLLNKTKKMILFPITNNNLIYSTEHKELDHCFMKLMNEFGGETIMSDEEEEEEDVMPPH